MTKATNTPKTEQNTKMTSELNAMVSTVSHTDVHGKPQWYLKIEFLETETIWIGIGEKNHNKIKTATTITKHQDEIPK